MLHGLMVVNAFLRTTKFDDIYHTLLSAAHGEGMELDVRTNAELCCETATGAFAAGAFDFVLFWDKDVQLAWQLEQLGMRVFNGASAILACDDKALTWLRLRRAGIPMPRTILAPKTFANVGYPQVRFAAEAARALGFPVVLKECFGSFGQQVYLFHDVDALCQKVQSLAGTPLLFQELIHESYGRDARINVVGGRGAACMHRRRFPQQPHPRRRNGPLFPHPRGSGTGRARHGAAGAGLCGGGRAFWAGRPSSVRGQFQRSFQNHAGVHGCQHGGGDHAAYFPQAGGLNGHTVAVV